jgi:hypothetical protein
MAPIFAEKKWRNHILIIISPPQQLKRNFWYLTYVLRCWASDDIIESHLFLFIFTKIPIGWNLANKQHWNHISMIISILQHSGVYIPYGVSFSEIDSVLNVIMMKQFGNNWSIDWLIDYLRFYCKNHLLVWRHHHYRSRVAKLRLMLGAQGLWVIFIVPHLHVVTWSLVFSGLIQHTAPTKKKTT